MKFWDRIMEWLGFKKENVPMGEKPPEKQEEPPINPATKLPGRKPKR